MSVAIIVIFNPLIIKETLGNPQHFILSAISNTRTHTHTSTPGQTIVSFENVALLPFFFGVNSQTTETQEKVNDRSQNFISLTQTLQSCHFSRQKHYSFWCDAASPGK